MASKKLLIANRGEVAIRIARASAALGWESVVVFSEDDADSKHRLCGDHSIALNGSGSHAYLDAKQLIRVAKETHCLFLHPGYGFLSENAEFAESCLVEGLQFIGPSSRVVKTLGDKLEAIRLAEQNSIPVLAGTRGPTTLAQSKDFFVQHGALMIKALSGGGGRGIRRVRNLDQMEEDFLRCSSEAKAAFGNGDLYVEQFLPRARHIEVQIVGDTHGEIAHLWERDCTLQRRNQKLIEVSPAPNLSPEIRDSILNSALRLARSVQYSSLGTFEFLVDEDTRGKFYFMEANPRLQVEHTVTEEVTGIDLLQLQLRIAAGQSLKDLGIWPEAIAPPTGFAIQLRINAETLDRTGNPQPSTGKLAVFEPSTGPGIRVDTGAYSGYVMNPSFDSLLAKLIVHSKSSRIQDAISLAYRALSDFNIQGVTTNKTFLQNLLLLPEMENYAVYTRMIDEISGSAVFEHSKVHKEFSFLSDKNESIPEVTEIEEAPLGTLQVPSTISGRLTEICVAEGEMIRKGQKIAIISAMKMEHVINTEVSGLVERIPISIGSIVAPEQSLLFVRPSEVIDSASEDQSKINLDSIRPDLQDLLNRLSLNEDSFRSQAVAKRHKRGQRTARENIADLCDPGTFVEYGALAIAAQRRRRSLDELIKLSPADGLITGLANVNGAIFDSHRSRCAVLAYDYTVFMGTQGAMNHKKTDRLLQVVKELQLPLVFFTEGGGGRPGEVDMPAVAGLDLHTFRQYASLKGIAPRIAITSGRCFAGNAALFGCSDITIATQGSNIGMGGPVMVKGGGLGNFSAEDIGPVDIQTKNGVVDILVKDEIEAVEIAKKTLSYFQGDIINFSCTDQRALRTAIPENRLRSYDIRSLIKILADEDSFLELKQKFAAGMVTAFIRIEGKVLGLVANDPTHLAGAIDAEGADKASDFIKLCDSFNIPILFLCDTPGFMVGPEVEKKGLVRKAGRLFEESAACKVPIFTVVLRKGYGLGAMAMAGGSFHAPVFTISWPSGEFGAMGIEGEIRTGFQKELAEIKDWNERQKLFDRLVNEAYERGKAMNMASYLEIDAVIDPADSRKWILRGLNSIPKTP
ncbi:carboxyl transferase domain protein [Leptospira broomii serovar Hurstbridge str. 5399]|uniref:acetyl-CoA carboxylase n=1 Tax=Leptospira broomii serovar Hurstbridge str. 5399 TaxID=1049789 RepID=T0GKC8_9LEPT|nr:carboxyl transferase domain-containing protein [Leptospira broomii]EQA45838.1 carboxyl transferase domain protein [Leptospira broomii serovar Hurstbridge str. 5399]